MQRHIVSENPSFGEVLRLIGIITTIFSLAIGVFSFVFPASYLASYMAFAAVIFLFVGLLTLGIGAIMVRRKA
ncbi:MAG: hypothetical protein Q8O43_00140 [Dehalococcoidia bacterium]|nr:hypothetical protein [Dehalococcoidia bacterium]